MSRRLTLTKRPIFLARNPRGPRKGFFKTALQPALRDRFSDPAYLQKTKTSPRVPIFKKAVANNKANLKTLYEAGVKVGFGTDSGAQPQRIPGLLNTENCNSSWKAVFLTPSIRVCHQQRCGTNWADRPRRSGGGQAS